MLGTLARKEHETGTNRRCGDSPRFIGEQQGIWRAREAPNGAMVSAALTRRAGARSPLAARAAQNRMTTRLISSGRIDRAKVRIPRCSA
jgi:hypothetical protein